MHMHVNVGNHYNMCQYIIPLSLLKCLVGCLSLGGFQHMLQEVNDGVSTSWCNTVGCNSLTLCSDFVVNNVNGIKVLFKLVDYIGTVC